ncbi:hypothetical protein [Paraburkholderia sediminicola]|uniref:hypothetical protein n=1 Tax=Paraburkholderia sediminicola TaxID=458836 RepID=UPI0038BB818A
MSTDAFTGVAGRDDPDEVRMLLRGEPHVQVRRHDTEDDVSEQAGPVARLCEPRKESCHAVEINQVNGCSESAARQ